MIHILIVEDHPVYCKGLIDVLSSIDDINIAGISNTLEDANIKLKTVCVDIILTDIDLPDGNGFELLEQYDTDKFHFIVLSIHNSISYIQKAFRLGAKSYLSKIADQEVIKFAIQEAYNGRKFIPNDITDIYINSIKNEDNINNSHKIKPKLTAREIEILKEILNELSSKEISNTLGISIHTVEAHKKNLFRKFKVRGITGLVKAAITNDVIDVA